MSEVSTKFKTGGQFLLESITDADKQAVKDRQLGIDTNTAQTDRLLAIPYIAEEFNKAKGGDPYWKELAKTKFLDPNDRDQFVTLFRLSERKADKDDQFGNHKITRRT